MYDLKRTFFGVTLEKEVASGSVVTEEGMLLIEVEEAGVKKVKPCNSEAAGVLVGFATMDNQSIATRPVIELVTIPSTAVAGAYLVTLANTLLVESSVYGEHDTTGTYAAFAGITYSVVFPGAPAPANCIFEKTAGGIVTGRVSFNAAQAGKHARFQYTYNLTVEESRLLFYQRNINNQASAVFGQVGVGMGKGEIFITNYDTAVSYAGLVAGALKLGPLGTITTAGGGAALAAVAVIKTPSVDDNTLGLRFNI